jgi:ubiquinone biosynthesis protein COQ4
MALTKLAVSTPMSEEAVARLAQTSGLIAGLRRVAVAVRAATALARDPDDTRQVFLLAVAIDRPALERTLQRLRRSDDGRALLAERPDISTRGVDYDALRALRPDTLGGAYARFLDARGLSPDIFHRPPGVPIEFAYVAQRIRQTHDVWHVLTGIDTNVPGEVMLQAFTRGQLGTRTAWVISVLGTLVYGLHYLFLASEVRRWHRIGKEASFLLSVRWESMWDEPLDNVRERVGIVGVARSSRAV